MSADDDMSDVRAQMEPHAPPDPIIIPFTDEAEALLYELEMEQNKTMDRYEEAGFADLFGRTVEQAMRLALEVALSCDSRKVRVEHVEWARDYVTFYHRQFAEKAMQRLGQGENEEIAEKLFKLVEKRGEDGIMQLRPESWAAALASDDDAQIALGGMVTLIEISRSESRLSKSEADDLAMNAPDLIARWVETLNAWRLAQHHAGQPEQPTTGFGKIGRNDPCPCGSGRKYKKCCGGN